MCDLSKHLKERKCKTDDYLEKRVSGKEKCKCKCPEPGICLESSRKSKKPDREAGMEVT